MSTPRSPRRGIFAALAVSAACLAALGLWAVPNVLSPWTFASMAAVVIGGAAVSVLTWRNAQPTSSVAQLLQATEAAGAQGPIRGEGTHTRPR